MNRYRQVKWKRRKNTIMKEKIMLYFSTIADITLRIGGICRVGKVHRFIIFFAVEPDLVTFFQVGFCYPCVILGDDSSHFLWQVLRNTSKKICLLPNCDSVLLMMLILFYEYSSCITVAPVAMGIRKSKPRYLSGKDPEIQMGCMEPEG